MKMYGEVDVYIHIFLTLALVGGEWSASRIGPFTPRERVAGAHWIGAARMGRRTSLYNMERRKILSCDPSAIQPVASRYTDCTI
jgi:hypothetical protein